MKKIGFLKLNAATCLAVILALSHREPALAQDSLLTQPGNFVVGCNYWASHAGTRMWSDWKPEVVDEDFAQLEKIGVRVIRIFPLWPDFQPIVQFRRASGVEKEIAFANGPLPATGVGASGMSEEALQHFQVAADLAEKHHIKLIVGLITGWMSGELFVPPALEGKNILNDATALAWQQRFVKTFVHRFKDHPAIAAWDFGNECNCMATVDNCSQAYVWSALLSATIRAEDPTRPVVSGMHSLSPAADAPWRIQDQAATTDLLTTHPYPFWTPYASQDPVNTIRTLLHSAAETRMYADIGNKPCLIEETGIMGPMRADEAVKAAFCRTVLFSGWANDCHGLLWWCAFDQNNLDFPPYSWVAVERDLGLIRTDKSIKPVAAELKKFREFLDGLPFKTLPLRKAGAVCLLTDEQDNWAVAYSAYILAKQAGFDLEFQMAGQKLKDAELYLVPSIKGVRAMSKATWEELLTRAKAGASVYLSTDNGFVAPFVEPFGLDVVVNSTRIGPAQLVSKNMKGELTCNLGAPWKMVLQPRAAVVLAAEPDGNPIFTETTYGQGKLYFLSVPLEKDLTMTPGAFDKAQPGYYKIYQQIAQPLINARVLKQSNPLVGVTEHTFNDHEKVVVLINYSADAGISDLQLADGWAITKSLYGELPKDARITIPANDAVVLVVKK